MSVKLDIFKIKKIIEKRGGKLLSEIYINNHAKLDVICELGHLWHPTVKSLKRGSWCSTCYNLTENRHKAKPGLLQRCYRTLSYCSFCQTYPIE